MRFDVRRASVNRQERPCEEARYNKQRKQWQIELKTLKDLRLFSQKYGDLVFTESDAVTNRPSILIYDTYIE